MNRILLSEAVALLDKEIPLALQESYDNCGVQVMPIDAPLTGVLVAVDPTEAVVQEAIALGYNLIVTHHPLLFKATKRISQHTYIERTVQLAIKHDIAIYAAHTNLDNARGGVNYFFAQLLGLNDYQALIPLDSPMYKVVVYVPTSHSEAIRVALRDAGVGAQGAYDGCSFSYTGAGRFRPLKGADPHCGIIGTWHTEPEEAIATMCHEHELAAVRALIRQVHPYEEPVIDLYEITHRDHSFGGGIIGQLPEPMPIKDFFALLRKHLPEIEVIAHSAIHKENVQRIAFCGGSGAFMRRAAAQQGADIFVTGEAKYNDYLDATDDITLVTLGHYESEAHTKKLLRELICRKIPTFEVRDATHCVNPVQYLR